METDFRVLFLLVETIIELGKIQFFKNIPARGSLFMVGETDFPVNENHFFLHFSETLVSFFRLVEKYFWRKSSFSASGNGV